MAKIVADRTTLLELAQKCAQRQKGTPILDEAAEMLEQASFRVAELEDTIYGIPLRNSQNRTGFVVDEFTVQQIIIRARLEGTCSHCAGRMFPGQWIEKTSSGWMHQDCPADPPDEPDLRWDRDQD